MATKQDLENVQIAGILRNLGRRSIVFVGLMGAGKTVIGRRVAACLGLPFIDSDHEIEAVSRMTVPELFERFGEAEFRALEQRVITRILENGPQVLSTGGGAYMSEQVRRMIKDQGICVWLKADIDTLMERVGHKQNRPLLNRPDPRAVMLSLMDERYPIYSQADVTVISCNETKEAVTDKVVAALEEALNGNGADSGKENMQ